VRWTLAILGSVALTAAAIYCGAFWSPEGQPSDDTSRLLYLHIPAAALTLAVFTVAAAASLIHLRRKSDAADQWARAAVGAAAVMGTLMLASGMVWARLAWNHWWDFKSPKLVLSLVLWILIVAYFVLRTGLGEHRHRSRIAAVYCLIAWLDVPLVYLAARLAAGDIHPPTAAALDAKPAGLPVALPLAFAAATAVTALLLAALLRHIRRRDARLYADD
jgi:heme exporter protein C